MNASVAFDPMCVVFPAPVRTIGRRHRRQLLLALQAVTLTAWIAAGITARGQELTASERADAFRKLREEHGLPLSENAPKAILKGTLHAPDGAPLRRPVIAIARQFRQFGATDEKLGTFGDTFSINVYPGNVWLLFQTDEFAPRIVGPFHARSGATIAGIDVMLEMGYPARIRVVDETGKPVEGAVVQARLKVDGGFPEGAVYDPRVKVVGGFPEPLPDVATDAEGVASIPHAVGVACATVIKARGFQTTELFNVAIGPDRVTTLKLVRARPTSGVILAEDRTPIAGAIVRVLYKRSPDREVQYPATEPILATSDERGRFRLDSLDEDATYDVLVETRALGRRVVSGVRADASNLIWTVGPAFTISGVLRGDLALLGKDKGKPVVEVIQHVRQGRGGPSPLTSTVGVEPADGGGRFRFADVLPGQATIRAGAQETTVDVTQPETSITLELSPQPTAPASFERRKVNVRLVLQEGRGPLTGSIRLTPLGDGADPPLDAALDEDGIAHFEVPVPGTFRVSPGTLDGYWAPRTTHHMKLGDAPFEIKVGVWPAGVIICRVLDADGKPAPDVLLVANAVGGNAEVRRYLGGVIAIPMDTEGRYFFGPLPIGETYELTAHRLLFHQAGPTIPLDGKTTTKSVELQLVRPVLLEGRVVDARGHPIARTPVVFELIQQRLYSVSTTDPEGRCRIEGLGPLAAGRVTVLPNRNYQPAQFQLTLGGPPADVRLQNGHIVMGRIVDDATGQPLPGVLLKANLKQAGPGDISQFEAEAPSDSKGVFRFSTLPPVPVVLDDKDRQLRWAIEAARLVTPDAGEPVEVRLSPRPRGEVRLSR
jgi:protocatechuate 3,4-dioxygenase beta subunit